MSDDAVADECVDSQDSSQIDLASEGDSSVDERLEVERQRDDYLDALQRLQADFENYRKRVARSADDAAARASGEIVAKLLPVLDAFDLARAHFAEAASDEAVAFDQARGLLLDALSREGLERLDATGVDFDPQVHDAVAHETASDEGATGPVVESVLRAGYRWKGAVLRPVMVTVRG